MSTPTPVSVKLNTIENVVITMPDGTTINAGSFTNAVANRNAPAQMLHDALAVFDGAKDTALSTAQAAATTAQAALAALQTKLNNLMIAYHAATTDAEKAAVVAQADAATTAGQQAALLAVIAKAKADQATAQAAHDALVAVVTPAPSTS